MAGNPPLARIFGTLKIYDPLKRGVRVRRNYVLAFTIGLVVGCGKSAAPDDPSIQFLPRPDALTACQPLPAPTGRLVRVSPSQASSLGQIIGGAQTGDTLLLADGKYSVGGQTLILRAPGVALRSESGARRSGAGRRVQRE